MDTTLAIISAALIISTAVAASFVYYIRFKRKLKAFREFIDLLDDALYDDRITEEEYRALWDKFKRLIND
ncbi:MAG: hypothetical protein QW475_04565 [Candidatus Nitrosocaldus sp.]